MLQSSNLISDLVDPVSKIVPQLPQVTVQSWYVGCNSVFILKRPGPGLMRTFFRYLEMALKLDLTVLKGEQGVVSPDTHVGTGMNLRSPLSHDDGARSHQLTTVPLHPEPLALAVPAVSAAAAAFL